MYQKNFSTWSALDYKGVEEAERTCYHGDLAGLNLQSEFNYSVPHRIVPKCAKIGIFDESGRTQLVAATTTNKVIISERDTVLNVNVQVRVLEVFQFDTDGAHFMYIGTESGIIGYDASTNRKIFEKDINDGVNCIRIDRFTCNDDLLIFCGSNCAIWGFDNGGQERYWTVTGDNVLALCFCDVDEDGINEIVAGSDDFDIRIFKDDLLLYEVNETDAVIVLQNLGDCKFAYALRNGTLGAYRFRTRLWRIKSKQQVVAINLFPDQTTLACAWQNGKLDIREVNTGEVVCKESVKGTIADAFPTGNHQLVVTTTDGNVFGFALNSGQMIADSGEKQMRELGIKKHNLMMELENYDQMQKLISETGDMRVEKQIPMDTETTVNLGVDQKNGFLRLLLAVSGNAIIRTVVLFGEGIFDGESFIIHPVESYSSELAICLRSVRDVPVDLHIKAMIGYPQSEQLHIFEVTRALPRFAMYVYCPENSKEPAGKLTFMIDQKVSLIASWICDNFMVVDNEFNESDSPFKANFFGLRNRDVLCIELSDNQQMIIRSDDMHLVGEIVQAIAESFQIKEISSNADFPDEINKLNDLIEKLNEMYISRDRLATAIAERANSIREMLVRAEDAHLMGKINLMRKYYLKLHTLNQAMMSEHQIRCNNYDQLLAAFRQLNKIIERGARLRVGEPMSRVISACRSAISTENFSLLQKIILFGV